MIIAQLRITIIQRGRPGARAARDAALVVTAADEDTSARCKVLEGPRRQLGAQAPRHDGIGPGHHPVVAERVRASPGESEIEPVNDPDHAHGSTDRQARKRIEGDTDDRTRETTQPASEGQRDRPLVPPSVACIPDASPDHSDQPNPARADQARFADHNQMGHDGTLSGRTAGTRRP